MNGPGDTPDAAASDHQQHPCGITSFLPLTVSCRGRAEAFARRLQSRLRTLGSQDDEDEDEDENTLQPSHTNGETSESNWVAQKGTSSVTNLQPLRLPSEAADAFFDFDLDDDNDENERESPGSPMDECGYTRLIETATTTPHERETESGYACASPCSSSGTVSDMSSSLYYDCYEGKMSSDTCQSNEKVPNGHIYAVIDSDTTSESLPPSQSTDSNITVHSTTSCSTLQDIEIMSDLPEPPPIEEDTETTSDCNELEKETQEMGGVIEEEVTRMSRLPSIVEDEEGDEERPAKLRRSSSLKSGKTPPGTPGRKKFVRFADIFGLDLADIKTFQDCEVPTIPKSAFEDLDYKTEPEIELKFGPPVEKVLIPLFQQPGGLPNFLDRVREKKVSLENAAVTDPINLTVTGTVRVLNLDFHKSVYVRYTLDSWKSYSDLLASYVDGSCDGFSDKFSFILFGNSLQLGQRIEMAIRFHCRGQQFWDSSDGVNYCFICLPPAAANNQKEILKEPIISQPNPTNEFSSGAFY